ncbi:hypothetical protein ACMD2_26904 [Ananas comosus]|uniref:Uncharacterized protein n=1 Tax=Ananas comosus TaxID=4615 RepID=A0A199USD7_ANACO|nr:hypothetical protein ACMD2_26904 [Ananas comosus]
MAALMFGVAESTSRIGTSSRLKLSNWDFS